MNFLVDIYTQDADYDTIKTIDAGLKSTKYRNSSKVTFCTKKSNVGGIVLFFHEMLQRSFLSLWIFHGSRLDLLARL